MTTTIQAQVSPRILQKAHLLFNQNPKTILHELLQNCRRADAKRVDISVSSTATGCEITIHDDGTGIADPSSLLNLGGSGWDESISNSESPAGMGFFSLSHLPGGVHVESGCWTVELNSDAFKGVAPCPVHSSCYIEGTKISFSLDLKFDVFIGVVSACVLYYPVSVFVNGNPAVQVDFPKESLFVHKAKGSSIALRENRSFWGPDLNLNFFGLTLKVELKPYWPFHFFVNVNDNEIVDLVLPSRDKVVENQKFEALKIECRRATYEYIFQLSIPHSLPYCYYQEAHRMGIMIPEAQAQLRRVKASNIWDSDSDWVGPDSGNLPIPAGELQVSANSIISFLDDSQFAALHLCEGAVPLLFVSNTEMEGYSWYPRRAVRDLVQELHYSNGEIESVNPGGGDGFVFGSRRPDEIYVEFHVTDGDKIESLRFPTFIAFCADETGEEGITRGWIPKAGSEVEKSIDECLLRALFFCPVDNRDYDEQAEDFTRDAESMIITVFGGENAAKLFDAHAALNDWSVSSAIKNLGLSEVTLVIQDGQIKIKETIQA